MKIAIIGFGGVGKSLVELLVAKEKDLERDGVCLSVNYILNSKGGIYNPSGIDCKDVMAFISSNRHLEQYPNGGDSSLNFDKLLEQKDIDVLIEMTPTNKDTGQPGLNHIQKALENGIHVVSANKGPILLAYKALRDIAKNNHAQLAVGCTAGGALPSVNGGLFDMAGSKISSIEGVLNGTTNFILSQMEHHGLNYESALKKAQEFGIAETNPSLDVEGWDTATKLLILTNILMNQNKQLSDIQVQGITKLTLDEVNDAKSKGQRYKLIGKSERIHDDIKLQVKLERVTSDDILFNVNEKDKVVRYTSDTLGELTILGGASGTVPAAASILRDLINIIKGYRFV